MDLRRSGSKKQNQKAIDDVLGDLLAEDPDFGTSKPDKLPNREKRKTSGADEDFYSSLATAAAQPDESDISEADVNQVAKSLADLDDLDADLFGGKYNKKKTGSGTPRQRTPRTPRAVSPPGKGGLARSSTPTSPPGSATGSRPAGRAPQATVKPSTAPGNIADLSRPSASLKPGDLTQERPRTVPKAKPKFSFGEFDEDDPLAGLLSDEDDDLDEAKTTPPETKGGNSTQSLADKDQITSPRGTSIPQGVQDREPLSPRRRRLMERPPTRGGDNNSSSDLTFDRLFDPPAESTASKKPTKTAVSNKKKDDVIFSDNEDDLLTGLEESSPVKPKPVTPSVKEEEHKPAKSVLDSLLGKDSVSKHLERPSSGSQKEFVLDSKYQKSQEEKEDDFLFGSYMPSMAGSTGGSRPGSRRSVRFEESDDIFSKPTSRGEGRPTSTPQKPASSGLDWLELATNGDPVKQEAAPAPVNKSAEKKKPGKDEFDWLGLKDSDQEEPDWLNDGLTKTPLSQTTQQQPKPEPNSQTPKPVTPSKKLYDDDAYSFLHDKPSNQQTTSQPPQPIRSQHRQESLSRDKKADDWLGLNSSSPETSAPDLSPNPDPQRDSFMFRRSGISMDQIPNLSVLTSKAELASARSPTPPSVTVDQFMGVTPTSSRNGTPVPSTAIFTPQGTQSSAMRQQHIQDAQRQLQLQMEEQIRIEKQQEELALQHEQGKIEDMITQLQQQYQANQIAKANLSSIGSAPSHGLLSAHKSVRSDPNYTHLDYETKVRKLEIELECLESRCDSNQRRYEEELVAMDMSYKNRIHILEESRKTLEEQLSEDSERYLSKHLSRLRDLEEEKSKMVEKMEEMEKEKKTEIERIKEMQRKMSSELKREYEESLERLRAVKNQEIDNITNAHSAAKSLQTVMQQVSSNAKDLGQLQSKVDTWNNLGLDEREIFIRTKDEQLNMLQMRLDKQQEENSTERLRLQDLITRLERQIAEQNRGLEEEKWKLKQEQGKFQTAQNSVEEGRRIWSEQQRQESMALDKAKDSLLQEQKMILSQLYEERRSMAEERSQLTAAQRLLREREQQQAIKYVKGDAEYDVTMKTVSEERLRSESRQRELEKAEEHVRSQQAEVERERHRLQQEQHRVSDLALQVKQKSHEVDHMASSASQSQDEGRYALEEAQKIEADHNNRAAQIQAQHHTLRVKEKEIAEERVVLAREKKEVEDLRQSMLCVNCRTPVRDVGLNPPIYNNISYSHPSHVQFSSPQRTPSGVPVSSPLRTDIFTIRPGVQVSANAVGAISASIESDKSVRMWKIQAQKDKDYLMEESMFLETLRQSPYHNNSRLSS